LPEKLESIPIVYAFPGATKDYLDGFINKYKGVVVVAYGSGNVSENMYYAIKSVIDNGLKVVLVTNCKYGGVYTVRKNIIYLIYLIVEISHSLSDGLFGFS